MNTVKITFKYAVALAFVALICVAVSILIHLLTKNKIENVILQQQQQLFSEVLPADYKFNDLNQQCYQPLDPTLLPHIQKIYLVKEGDSLPLAYALETTAPDGYSGKIRLLVALTPSGTILGVRTLEHKETPGLGDKIELRISDWILTFAGKQFDEQQQEGWAVKKDGGQFDQFTGATITPRAVVNAVKNSAILMLKQYPKLSATQFKACDVK